MLDLSLISGPVPVLVLVAGWVAFLALAIRRGQGWWSRRVPLAAAIGLAATGTLVFVVQVLWQPFPDPLPGTSVLWTGLIASALALALLRPVRWRVKAVALVAVLIVAVTGSAQINQYFAAYPTLRSALGLPLPSQVAFGSIPAATAAPIRPVPGTPISATWSPPANLPAHGAVTTASIPGVVSGFHARPAWIYLPPAYLSSPRSLLPVLVLVPGQPGSPRDWFDGGRLAPVLDGFAAAHHGLAPIVVVPDPLGEQLAEPLCVDSARGHAFTYLTMDVPAWIRRTFQVDPDPAHWAVGGASAGGTCALQLAVNAPAVYPTLLDLSGQVEPTVGSRSRTVAEVFGGDLAAFRRVNPLDVLASHPFPHLAATVVVGRDDTLFRPQAQRVAAALRAAGVPVRYVELPGGHSWWVWSPGLQQSLPWLAQRMGLTP